MTFGVGDFSSHMDEGEENSEQNTKVELSTTTSHDDSDNININNNNGNGNRSGQTGQDGRRG